MAIEEVNAHGGIRGRKLVARVEDSRETTPSESITAFRALVSDPGIRMIIGPSWTQAGMALAPLAAQENLILVTPSMTVSDFSKTASNIFNTMPPEDLMTKALAAFAVGRGWRRIAVFASQHPAELVQGQLFASRLKELGGEVVYFADSLPDAPDVRIEALKVQESKPDAVYISVWWGNAPKALRAAGYRGPLLTRQLDRQRLESAAGALNGAYFPRYPKASVEFETRYRQRFNEDPALYAATSYDAVKLYARIGEELPDNNARALSTAFAAIEFEGASGLIRFGPDRTILNRSVEISQVAGESLDGPALSW